MIRIFERKGNLSVVKILTVLVQQLSQIQAYSIYGVIYGSYNSDYQQWQQAVDNPNNYANYGMYNELQNYHDTQLTNLLGLEPQFLQTQEQQTVFSDDAYTRNYLSTAAQNNIKKNKKSKARKNYSAKKPYNVPDEENKVQQKNSFTQKTQNQRQEILEQGAQEEIVHQESLKQGSQEEAVPKQNQFESQTPEQNQPTQQISNQNADNSNEESGIYIPHKPKYIDQEEEEQSVLQGSSSETRRLSAAEITGIVVGCMMFLVLIASIVGAVYFYLVRPNGQILCQSLLC
eukprot:TRINITY_DN4355_c0_g1_i2.p1 TRINITY_DN4355_c0_g1~~TRINITY_DN4355_c0_g1_i2.p1  ORF type:complete len:288 (-),score=26.66 TRINITY_DN4355_c0_g1_i2:419-1282(-)